uniref:Uncharacterized protein n=1 Tax=viral metagenome TaxID=1070528 RepID=A0A6C0I5W0_9ZZZZ
MIFDSTNIYTYLFGAMIIISVGYFSSKIKKTLENEESEYEIIRKYLLNDSPLYGFNRPKIWIHSKYEVNSRKWKDFSSRNTTDLNQPYIHLTIKTIINHCGDDFNICLIDDDSFSKLLPSWDIYLSAVAEPMKSHLREMGMAELLYYYGGMVLPNSFLCMKNLISFYQNTISYGRPFVCEAINRTTNLLHQKHKLLFIPDLSIMGAAKNDPVILELIEMLKARNKSCHFAGETDFVGDTSQWCLDAIRQQKLTLVGGETIGVKTAKRKTILLENLMEEEYIDFDSSIMGVYIPGEEILRRPKFQWFAVLPSEQVISSNMIISKLLMASIADTTQEYSKKREVERSVVSI